MVPTFHPHADWNAPHKSQEDVSINTLKTADHVVYSVWFGTNRKPIDPNDASIGFTNERSDSTILGRVDVFIPKAHRFGEIGSGFWTRLRRGDLRNDRLLIEAICPLSTEKFWLSVRTEMEEALKTGDAPHGLLFIHGYKNSFADAAIRAAQIGFDLKVTGATAFFSWPSRGTVAGYAADEAMIEASEEAITHFLVNFVRMSGAEKVHVVAHSMGNRGLLRTLQRIAADAETSSSVRFGQIFLAAPDVDRKLFLSLAKLYPACSQRTTLYASSADRALQLSARFHAAPRAGYFLPYTVATGIDSVAVPNFDLDLLGHGYYAQAEAILHDMYDLTRHNAPPQSRLRVEPLIHGTDSLWQIRR
jgi:esterase/lipase superfamily enzyme